MIFKSVNCTSICLFIYFYGHKLSFILRVVDTVVTIQNENWIKARKASVLSLITKRKGWILGNFQYGGAVKGGGGGGR